MRATSMTSDQRNAGRPHGGLPHSEHRAQQGCGDQGHREDEEQANDVFHGLHCNRWQTNAKVYRQPVTGYCPASGVPAAWRDAKKHARRPFGLQ